MSDGITLETFICHEKNFDYKNRMSVILQRSPYAHAFNVYKMHGTNLAKRGFIYIIQFCRGTGGSEGEWEPNVNERSDGLDTLNWLQKEDWVKNIGFWGDSYLALTGWCMADEVPEKLKGMYLGVYGTDRFTSAYCKGLFRHDVLTSWAMENAGFPIDADYIESCKFRPHVEVDEKLWGKQIPWYRDWIISINENDEYWQTGFWKMLKEIPSKVSVPLLITDAWYDHHLGSAIKSYESLNEEIQENCTFLVGCWNHFSQNCIEWDTPSNLQNAEVKSMTEWFVQILMDNKIPEKEIKLYIIGADKWIKTSSWPMPIKEKRKFFLSTNCSKYFMNAMQLENQNPNCESNVTYKYDPVNPVPSIGAESMLKSMNKVGSMFQPNAGFRKDVISFISDSWTENHIIAGAMKVHLCVSSDCEDTSFSAKVMEIRKDGNAVNIRSSVTTIAADRNGDIYIPGTVTEVCIEMWDIAWEIKKGSRIRVDISSSDFPQYSVHCNYPGIWSRQENMKIAHQVIWFGDQYSSYLEIPLLDEEHIIDVVG
ncbi:MAG: CocE/NonD family hydrolase [Lachnospiraceae bacterium]